MLAGAGIGLINPPLASTAVGVVHHSRSGMASGINNTFRQVGIATGIAGLGAIFQHDVTRNTTAALSPAEPGAKSSPPHTASSIPRSCPATSARSPTRCPAPRAAALMHSYRVGFTAGLHEHPVIAACVALVGSVFAFALVRSRDFVASGEPGGRARRRAAAAAG